MAFMIVVDDSKTIRTLVRKALEDGGHEVIEAVDGVDAMAQLSSPPKTIEMIISDINMPNMDGLTMVQKLREQPTFQKTPVIVLSTETSPEMKSKGKEIGVTAWMAKPPNPAKLLEAVGKILAMTKA